MSLLFGITSASVWIGLVAFSLFYGLNVLVFLVRSLILKDRFQRQLNTYCLSIETMNMSSLSRN